MASSSRKNDREVEEPINLDDSEGEETQNPNKNAKQLQVPKIGTEFQSIEEAQQYYQNYAQQNGFQIRVGSPPKSKKRSSNVVNVQFVCEREGKCVNQRENDNNLKGEKEERENKRMRSASTVKCGCKASLRIKFDKPSGKWKVLLFNPTHNHELVRGLTETFHGEISESSEPKPKYKPIQGGEINALVQYLIRKNLENPLFYYDIMWDENARAVNFFWADVQSRVAYQYFGDVVTLGLSCKKNKYNLPFATFIGVNHHMQSIQFGCAILQDETEMSFKWLFQTWLEAMWKIAPKSIITTENLEIKNAICEVFPNTKHRLCIWNVMKQFIHKLGKVYYKGSKFKEEIEKCVWSTYKKEDFEGRWSELMKEFGLENNDLIKHFYEIREFWVPVYNRGTFFAGMNTIGRTSGINSFFKDFVSQNTNLIEFVVKNEQVLNRIEERENDEDYVSEHKYPIVDKFDYLLKDAAKIYTRNIFNKFKEEMKGSSNYRVEQVIENDGFNLYFLKSNHNEFEKFTIKLNSETYEGSCECQHFEFVGILCRHILKVLYRNDVYTIPAHFIMDRWRQKANRAWKEEDFCVVGFKESKEVRMNHLMKLFAKLACIAARSKESCKFFMEGLEDLKEKLLKITLDEGLDIEAEQKTL